MGNARTREEIGYVTCPECFGARAEPRIRAYRFCGTCYGAGRVLKETPRLAVQRHEGGRWETLLRVDGDDFSAAETYRDAYQKERPAKYRIVQEIDEELGNEPPTLRTGLTPHPRGAT